MKIRMMGTKKRKRKIRKNPPKRQRRRFVYSSQHVVYNLYTVKVVNYLLGKLTIH